MCTYLNIACVLLWTEQKIKIGKAIETSLHKDLACVWVTWLWEESVIILSNPDPHNETCWVWDNMYSHCFFHWLCHYLHYLYTDSETHVKVVVVSETFEGIPLLEVCREQNHCLIPIPFLLLVLYKAFHAMSLPVRIRRWRRRSASLLEMQLAERLAGCQVGETLVYPNYHCLLIVKLLSCSLIHE